MESYNLGTFFAIWLVCFLLTRIGLGVMFKKAGIKPWLAFIPIVSWWFWIKLVGRPSWYIIGMIIPCVNILFSFNIMLDILRAFGQFKFWQQLLGTVFTFIYFPYLALKHKSLTYLGKAGTAEWKQNHLPPSRGGREWADAILFAMYVAGGMRGLYFDLFQIPTSSMESNMLVGDFLIVNRANVGMRIPMTPLTVPAIAHQELPIGGIKAYSDIIQLPYMRLPGWHTIKNNDIIVFNVPFNALNPDEFNYPVDKRTYYVKRCVGIPGDNIEVKNRQVLVNGKPLPLIGKAQRAYKIRIKDRVTKEWMLKYNLSEIDAESASGAHLDSSEVFGKGFPYIIHTWKDNIAKIKKDPEVLKVDTIANTSEMQQFIDPEYMKKTNKMWSADFFGPVHLPKRGETVTITEEFLKTYELALKYYEKVDITTDGKTFFMEGSEVKTYTFKYGYYWMMGDNRDNSLDSRAWGMVPENHIVGTPVFSFFSMHKIVKLEDGVPVKGHEGPIYETVGVNWDRIFKFFE